MRPIRIAGLAAVIAVVAACSNHSRPTVTQGVSTTPSGSQPASATPITGASQQVEVNPAGDIPDNQAFVPYLGTGFSVRVPEGWARTTKQGDVTFADKYNNIVIAEKAAVAAPTAASVRRTELPAIQASARGFVAGTVITVHRSAGIAVLITYRALSAVNPVTGKVANESVERYEFWRSGREVVLTLAAPVGSDNVDPWRKVTDSFIWAGK